MTAKYASSNEVLPNTIESKRSITTHSTINEQVQFRTSEEEKLHNRARPLSGVSEHSGLSVVDATTMMDGASDFDLARVPTTTIDNMNRVGWDSEADPHNPANWSTSRKVICITAMSTVTFLAPLASSMFAPAIVSVMEEFHVQSLTFGAFSVSVYVLGFGKEIRFNGFSAWTALLVSIVRVIWQIHCYQQCQCYICYLQFGMWTSA